MESKNEIQKAYFAIIPANVRYDSDLTPNAKLLYGEITALCNEKGYCWATNAYFSELYGVSKVSIGKWISQLVEKQYLYSEIVYKEGTKEILGRYLTISNASIKEKLNRGIKENLKGNQSLTNNKLNTNKLNTNNTNNSLSKDNSLPVLEKKLIKKPTKKEQLYYSLVNEVLVKSKLNSKDIIRDLLIRWLNSLKEINKLPSSISLEESLFELEKYSDDEIKEAIEKSIRGGYKTFYPQEKSNISADGINRNPKKTGLEKEKEKFTSEYVQKYYNR